MRRPSGQVVCLTALCCLVLVNSNPVVAKAAKESTVTDQPYQESDSEKPEKQLIEPHSGGIPDKQEVGDSRTESIAWGSHTPTEPITTSVPDLENSKQEEAADTTASREAEQSVLQLQPAEPVLTGGAGQPGVEPEEDEGNAVAADLLLTVGVPPEADLAAAEASVEPGLAEGEAEEEDRHNFALAKDGAKVVAANKEAKKTGALLDSDGDTFLKNECKADKWVIVELSQVTKMDTLVLSQNELYSSRVKEFEIRGRQTHPRTEGTDYGKILNSSGWQFLGAFNASNVKGTQAFKFERPTWLKYLQIRMLSHYGTEAVCALNDVGVYGKSAAEDLEDRLNLEVTEEALPGDEPQPLLLPALEPDAEVLAASVLAADPDTGPHSSLPPEPEKNNPDSLPVHSPSSEAEGAARPGESAASPPAGAQPPQPAAPSGLQTPSQQTVPPPEPPVPGTEQPGSNREAKSAVEETVSSPVPEASAEAMPATPSVKEQLPLNSAGSAANRHGGSLYDVLVQELKAIKLAQKASARTLAQLQKNVTAVMGGFAFELDLLASRMSLVDPPRPAIMPPAEEVCVAPEVVGSNGSHGLAVGQCANEPMLTQPLLEVVKPPTELELLQLEVAALREAVNRSKQQADSMLIALACSLLGGAGTGFAFQAVPQQLLLKSILLAFASFPVLAGCFWMICS